MLTDNQRYVLLTLRRRGFCLIAEAAEQRWQTGRAYYIDRRVRIPGLRRAFRRGNKEAKGGKRHGREA